jgi:hypothetical protein
MSVAAAHHRVWFLAVLATVVALLLPPDAGAKFTCQERGAPLEGIVLRGLPARPIAARTYTLTVTSRTVPAVNPSPYLGAAYCGGATEAAHAGSAGGSFRRLRGPRRDVFSLELRFPRPGLWALSFMDLDGSFHDLGLRRVRALPNGGQRAATDARSGGAIQRPMTRAGRSGGFPAAIGLGAGFGSLALIAGLVVVARRGQRG